MISTRFEIRFTESEEAKEFKDAYNQGALLNVRDLLVASKMDRNKMGSPNKLAPSLLETRKSFPNSAAVSASAGNSKVTCVAQAMNSRDDIHQTPTKPEYTNYSAGMSTVTQSCSKLLEEKATQSRLHVSIDLEREKASMEQQKAILAEALSKTLVLQTQLLSKLNLSTQNPPVERSNFVEQERSASVENRVESDAPMIAFHQLRSDRHKPFVIEELQLRGVKVVSPHWYTLRCQLRTTLFEQGLLAENHTKTQFYFVPLSDVLKKRAKETSK